MTPKVVAFLYLLAARSSAAITFLEGPSANKSIYSATVNKEIGPQASSRKFSVSAKLILYNGPDSCQDDDVDVNGKVVYLTENGACADEIVYENFYARGALAILRSTDYYPGSDYHLGNPRARRYPEWNAIQFLEIGQDDAALIMANNHVRVKVAPDPNQWESYYSSMKYQFLLRWLPSTIAFITFFTALVFSNLHIRIIHCKYLNAAPIGAETMMGFLKFALQNSNVSFIALSIELVSSFTLMTIWLIGGFWSTSNISAPVVRFFATQLSGFGYITTLLSARYWHHMEAELMPSTKPGQRHVLPACVKRALRGHIPIVNALSLGIPFLLDMILNSLYASYRDRQYPEVIVVNALLFVTIDITIAIYFLLGSVKLQIQMGTLLRKLQNDGEDLRRFRFRMIRCAFGLSISMFAVVGATLIAGIADSWYKSPEGWTVCWSIFTNFRIMQSLFHVIMFQPVTKSGPCNPNTDDVVPDSIVN